MASRPEPHDAQHLRTQKRRGSMNGCGNNRPGSATTLIASVSELFQDQRQVLQSRSAPMLVCPRATVTDCGWPTDRARGGHELLMVRLWA